MSTPARTTALMGLFAAVLSAAAAWYYPWPTAAQDRLGAGGGLFPEFEPGRVWSVEIIRHDADRQFNEQLLLQRQGERWVIPTRASFPASNVARRTAVIGAVARLADGKLVLQRLTDRQEDHALYGVVDPLEFQQVPNRGGVGVRVSLEDRNQQPLATLIVGRSPEDSSQRQNQAFVRIPGQPQVFLCEFDPEVLSTAFRDWVDPNLFGLRTQSRTDGEMLRTVVLQSGSRPPDGTGPAGPQWRARIAVQAGRLAAQGLEISGGGEWKEAGLGAEAANQLVLAASRLAVCPVDDARPVEDSLASSLASGAVTGPPELYRSMATLGFRVVSAPGEPLRLDSEGGRITVRTESGLEATLYLGSVFMASQTQSKLARCGLLIATAAPDQSPRPDPPAGPDGGEPTEEQQREYARTLEAWNNAREALASRINTFNAQHARWYYVFDESTAAAIVPSLSGTAAPAPVPPAGAESSSDPAAEARPDQTVPDSAPGSGPGS